MAETQARPVIDDERLLDGADEVMLAPVKGADRRRGLPRTMFVKSPSRFTSKFVFSVVLIGGGYAAIAMSLAGWLGTAGAWAATAVSVLVIGLMYGHLVELQHETLHEHAYRSRRLNRIFGFISGGFMLSSFSHYKFEHLRHHAFLGTPQNTEFFNYRFRGLDSWLGFLYATFHLGRYKDVFANIARSLSGRPIPGVNRDRDLRRIRAEYRLFATAIVAGTAISVITGSYFIIFAWVLPLVLVAEASHFLIEMPEHFGLNTQTDSNVLTNTRTVNSTKFAAWYTNYNNLHTAHHYHQGVPMARVPNLHEIAKDKFQVVEDSYPSFYLKVIHGEYRYEDMNKTVMTR